MKRRFLFSVAVPVVFVLFSTVSFAAEHPYKSGVTASFYADKFHGRRTSNGERFNMYALTAAHKTLPFNTIVKVTNLANGKSVNVRINDRGPFVAGREIDLSKAAAEQIGMIGAGTANVSLAVVDSERAAADSSGAAGGAADSSRTQPAPWEAPEDVDDMRWDIQIGAYAQEANATAMARRLIAAGFTGVVYQKTKTVTRVAIKAIPTARVQSYLDELESKGFTDYFVHERKIAQL